MTWDWHEWHRAYDQPDSPLSRRLAAIQQLIRDALDAAPPGQIRVISMCAGDGRDLLGAIADHPRRGDVQGRLVELDARLCATARATAPAAVDVLCADAGASDAYADMVPADLVLVCGVFGNISDDDMFHTLDTLPTLCAEQATVLWTRHRRAPDVTPALRKHMIDRDFEEIAFIAPPDTIFGIGAYRFHGHPERFRPGERIFEFMNAQARQDLCQQCGFYYGMTHAEILPWMRSDTDAFLAALAEYDDSTVRHRPAPDVWSPLEYACHVRDVLRVQRERVLQAQREDEPTFTPMRRDERVVEERYNEQDPKVVAVEIAEASAALIATLESLDDAGWVRTGIYNYPQPQPRTVEWIAVHTLHELLHHRTDIGTLA
ncbi:MAG TPA: DinB family protein [Acidimicrobiia bacterium]|jgi:hypothetical protein|nr:DinB family protein [Acidimicrobiia bacterium]